MPSSHLILCHPLLLLPSILPSIRIFFNESLLLIRWPKYWSFSFSISPSKEYSGLISIRWTGWISLQSKELSRVFSNTTVQKHQFLGAQPSLWSSSHICTDDHSKHSSLYFLLRPTAALGYNSTAITLWVVVNVMPNIQMFRSVQMVDLGFAVLLPLGAWSPLDTIQWNKQVSKDNLYNPSSELFSILFSK